ncbi:MAG: hypothetical protein ACYDDE_03910, partial [bacterium]
AKLNYIGVAGGDGPYPSKDDDECKQEAKLNYIGVAGGDGPYPSKDDDECKQEAKLNYIGVAGGDGHYPSKDDDECKQEAKLNYIGAGGAGASNGGSHSPCSQKVKNKDKGQNAKNENKEGILLNSTYCAYKTTKSESTKPIKPDETEKVIGGTEEKLNSSNSQVQANVDNEEELKRLKRLANTKKWRESHKEEIKEYRQQRLNKKANANKVNKKVTIVIDEDDKSNEKYKERGIVVKDKENIIKDIVNGFSLSQIKNKYKISGTTYYRYKAKYGIAEKENKKTKKSELTSTSTVVDIDKLQSSIIQNSLDDIKLSENPQMAKWQQSMVARGL